MFKVYHGTGKDFGSLEGRQHLTDAENFDQLASVLRIYRKMSYSNLTIFHPKEKGLRVDNIPQSGKQTGWMEFDDYGCWYEVEPDNGCENFLMIGDYPYQY